MSEGGERLGWFLVEEEVARTAAGRILRAKDTDLGVLVSLEVLSPLVTNDASIVKRFRDEIRQARSADHPGFSRPNDVVVQDDVTFVMSEWIVGESLATRLTRGAIDVVEAVRFVRKAAEAITPLHRFKLVHRGLSPDALVVRPDGFLVVVRMAPLTPGEAQRLTGRVDKSPFTAPEAQRAGEVSAAADVFALGAILYALIAGAPPDRATRAPLSTLSPDVPPALDDVLARVLADAPEERPRDAAALIEELLPLEALMGISDPHATVGAAAAPPPRQKKSERDLPTRETTRVTEPTHVMALPPYSQFSLESPTGATILPEMLVDELLMPRGGRSQKDRPPASSTGAPVAIPDRSSVPSEKTEFTPLDGEASGQTLEQGLAIASGLVSPPVDEATARRAVPRPVTAAHAIPSDDDARELPPPDDALSSSEATELSLTPPSHMAQSATPPPKSDDSVMFPAELEPMSIPSAESGDVALMDDATAHDLRPPEAEPSSLGESTLPLDVVMREEAEAVAQNAPVEREMPGSENLVIDSDEAPEPRDTAPLSSSSDDHTASSPGPSADDEPFFAQSETSAATTADDDDDPDAKSASTTSPTRDVAPPAFEPVATQIVSRGERAAPKKSPPRVAIAAAGVAVVVVVIVGVIALSSGDDETVATPVAPTPPVVASALVDAGSDDVADPPEPTVEPAGVDTRPVDDDRTADKNMAARVLNERKAVSRAMTKRGLRPGDDEALDRALIAASMAAEAGDHKEALAELVRARRRTSEVDIDAPFLTEKLARARAAVKEIDKPASKKKAAGFVNKAAQLMKKKPKSAHVYMNRALNVAGVP